MEQEERGHSELYIATNDDGVYKMQSKYFKMNNPNIQYGYKFIGWIFAFDIFHL
jgi:hypothetical protein